MRKANFSPVHGAIAGCFDEGKIVGILGIENDAIDSLLLYVRCMEVVETKEAYLDGVHDYYASGEPYRVRGSNIEV